MISLAAIAGSAAAKMLAPIALRAGAPILTKILKSKLGATGDQIVDAVAKSMGIDPTPEAIAEVHAAEPERVEEVFRQVEAIDPQYWQALASMSEQVNETMRAEGQSTSVMQRIWRPVFGIIYGVTFLLVMLSIVWLIVTGNIEALNALIGLSGLLMGLMGMGAAVLGVYVWKRSAEKIAGATGSPN